jgi:hypothetical protein
MRSKRSTKNPADAADSRDEQERGRQKKLKEEAASDEVLREQTRTEVEERPYLDTEGGD